MHTLKLLQKPCKLHAVRYGMIENSEFIVTNGNYLHRCDLGSCVVQMRPPYFVAKLHLFKTGVKNVNLAERNDKERCEWLVERQKAYAVADEAAKKGLTIKELCGEHYDELIDEPRMVAKVPGLNAYLELYGTMGPQDTNGEEYWQQNAAVQPFDRMIDAAAATALNRMAYFIRSVMRREDQRDLATRMEEWQPRDDWQEDYDYDEYFQKPEQRGIGFDYVDADRHPTPFVKHKLNEAEKQEYNRLKAEATAAGQELDRDTLAKLQQKATANVANAKLMADSE